ncbi:MAG: glucosaminidase domain-containing protein [Bacteroidota bacterium]
MKYIEKYKDAALEEMFEYGIPASITIAQGIIESGSGTSNLARKSNNHFGIKCATWDGPTSYRWDDGGNACFRSYDDVCDSFRDHSYFLKFRARYEFLFDLSSKDYIGWAHGLKKAGYATAPDYAHQVIKIIQDYQLYKFDMSKDEIAEFNKKAVENTKAATLSSPNGSSADNKSKPEESIRIFE